MVKRRSSNQTVQCRAITGSLKNEVDTQGDRTAPDSSPTSSCLSDKENFAPGRRKSRRLAPKLELDSDEWSASHSGDTPSKHAFGDTAPSVEDSADGPDPPTGSPSPLANLAPDNADGSGQDVADGVTNDYERQIEENLARRNALMNSLRLPALAAELAESIGATRRSAGGSASQLGGGRPGSSKGVKVSRSPPGLESAERRQSLRIQKKKAEQPVNGDPIWALVNDPETLFFSSGGHTDETRGDERRPPELSFSDSLKHVARKVDKAYLRELKKGKSREVELLGVDDGAAAEGSEEAEQAARDAEASAAFLDDVRGLSVKQGDQRDPKVNKTDHDAKHILRELQKLRLKEQNIAKVVPSRGFSLDVHPSTSKVLVAAGDKWGNVGLWDVNRPQPEKHGELEGLYLYSPHVSPVNNLQFSRWHPHHLVTLSYDGTVRCGDFTTGQWSLVFATDYSINRHSCKAFDFHSQDVLIIGNQDRSVVVCDTRTPWGAPEKAEAQIYRGCHDDSLKSVSTHPVDNNVFLTSARDGSARLWDLRKMQTSGKVTRPVHTLRHPKGLQSAYFSPRSGRNIATVCLDDCLRVFEQRDGGGEPVLAAKVRHNNHVGRWLTNFRTTWHPRRDDMFLCGALVQPRVIELWSDKCHLLHAFEEVEILKSVCSINTFHPSLNVVAGINSSGKVHVFM